MKSGVFKEYSPETASVDLGIPSIAPFTVPAEDRNRTSPFPYGGHRFEFRAVRAARCRPPRPPALPAVRFFLTLLFFAQVGSAQNVSMVNTVLCTIFADSFAEMSKQIEAGKKPAEVAAGFLKDHWKCIFNGNGYSEEWPIEAGKRGVWRIDSGVEAMARIAAPENIALFERQKVMSAKECTARAEVMHDHYTGYVEIEAMAMVDMLKQHGETLLVLPVLLAACLHPIALSCDKPHVA
jgi:glutamine synthetase